MLELRFLCVESIDEAIAKIFSPFFVHSTVWLARLVVRSFKWTALSKGNDILLSPQSRESSSVDLFAQFDNTGSCPSVKHQLADTAFYKL